MTFSLCLTTGLVLMDQSMMAGVGNIYRAEILFKAKVHPETPANSLSRELFELVWHHSVDLLQRGFKTGSILTVDPEDARKLGQPWTRRYGSPRGTPCLILTELGLHYQHIIKPSPISLGLSASGCRLLIVGRFVFDQCKFATQLVLSSGESVIRSEIYLLFVTYFSP